jgi:hypothetical protein
MVGSQPLAVSLSIHSSVGAIIRFDVRRRSSLTYRWYGTIRVKPASGNKPDSCGRLAAAIIKLIIQHRIEIWYYKLGHNTNGHFLF